MPRYLLELYLPRGRGVTEAVAQAERVQGSGVRYVRTMFVAEDETCFHVFEATSREDLLAAASTSGFTEARITETVESENKEGT